MYLEKIVAFIDILGFKNLVQDEAKCEDIGVILKLPYLIRTDDIAKRLKIKGVMMTSISDSIVFSIETKERGAMNKIVKLLSVFMQVLLFQYGLLLRGGIAVGKLYHDREVVYGPALIKAYDLESKFAEYPRIIMACSDFDRSCASCSTIAQAGLREMFFADDSCNLTLDCFYYIKQPKLEIFRSQLERMKTSDLRAQQKINWMMTVIDKKLEEQLIRSDNNKE